MFPCSPKHFGDPHTNHNQQKSYLLQKKKKKKKRCKGYLLEVPHSGNSDKYLKDRSVWRNISKEYY